MTWRDFAVLIVGAAVVLGYAYLAGKAAGQPAEPPLSLGIVFPPKDTSRLEAVAMPGPRTQLARA